MICLIIFWAFFSVKSQLRSQNPFSIPWRFSGLPGFSPPERYNLKQKSTGKIGHFELLGFSDSSI